MPYFQTGLENNEYCVWIVAEPIGASRAHEALRSVVPDYAQRFARGQIEIIPYTDGYLHQGTFDPQRMIETWQNRLQLAKEHRFEGARLSGNLSWLNTKNWDLFTQYEASINVSLSKEKVLLVCNYALANCADPKKP